MGVAPSTSRAAFACGGVGRCPIYGGRRPQIFLCPHFTSRDDDPCCGYREKRFRNYSDHSPPAPETPRCRTDNNLGRLSTHPLATREHHPFRLLSTQGPRNCKTRASGGYAGGTPKSACSCRRPWLWGQGGRGRRRPSKGRRYVPRQQQQQQHWSRSGGMPRWQQQQQHWSRGGGMPRQPQQQQQWSRGGGIPY